jgi:hypothetical protein
MCNWTYQWLRVDGEHSAQHVADYFWRLVMEGISATTATEVTT